MTRLEMVRGGSMTEVESEDFNMLKKADVGLCTDVVGIGLGYLAGTQ